MSCGGDCTCNRPKSQAIHFLVRKTGHIEYFASHKGADAMLERFPDRYYVNIRELFWVEGHISGIDIRTDAEVDAEINAAV